MVSISLSVPFSSLLPCEVIEKVIDCSFRSKKNLLAFSLVDKCCLVRSRYWILKYHLHSLLLESCEEISTFSALFCSPLCTFRGHSFVDISIRAASPAPEPNDSLQSDAFVLFLQHANAIGCLSIALCPRSNAYYSPLWSYAKTWTELSMLDIGSTVPSLSVVTSVILSLPRLTGLSIDAEYCSDNPVIPRSDDVLPPIENLCIGPHGYSLLSWLARFTYPTPIETVYLKVGEESIAPLGQYATLAGYGVENLTVCFYDSLEGLQQFIPCMPLFDSLLELDFQVGSNTVPILDMFITSVVPLIASPALMLLTVYVPPLPRLFKDERRLHSLVKQCLRETPVQTQDPTEDHYCSPMVCQRSWMDRVLP